jgi:hypothetical protein
LARFGTSNAAQWLRRQGLFASAVSVFIQNSPFDQAKVYGRTETIALPAPTECSLQITNAASWLLKKMYQPEVYYQKTGVMLSELVPQEGQQKDLFAYSSSSNRSGKLMDAMDKIRQVPAQHGSSSLRGYRPNMVHAAQLQESELHGRMERFAGGEVILDSAYCLVWKKCWLQKRKGRDWLENSGGYNFRHPQPMQPLKRDYLRNGPSEQSTASQG